MLPSSWYQREILAHREAQLRQAATRHRLVGSPRRWLRRRKIA